MIKKKLLYLFAVAVCAAVIPSLRADRQWYQADAWLLDYSGDQTWSGGLDPGDSTSDVAVTAYCSAPVDPDGLAYGTKVGFTYFYTNENPECGTQSVTLAARQLSKRPDGLNDHLWASGVAYAEVGSILPVTYAAYVGCALRGNDDEIGHLYTVTSTDGECNPSVPIQPGFDAF